MKQKLTPLAMLAMMGLSLHGCGGGGVPLTNAAAVTVLSNLNTALSFVPQSNTVPTLPVSGGGISTSAVDITPSSLATCQTVTPDPTIDADADNIAEEKNYNFNCIGETDGTSTVTRKGTMSIFDLDENTPGLLGGLKVIYDIDTFNTENADSTKYENSYNGEWIYRMDGSRFVFNSDFTGRYSFDSPANDYEIDYIFKYVFDYSLLPNDQSNIFNGGEVEFSGEYSFEGKFLEEESHKSIEGRYVIQIYSQELMYNSTCSKFYQSGSIFIDDNNGNIFEFRYSCTSAKVYRNGQEFTELTI